MSHRHDPNPNPHHATDTLTDQKWRSNLYERLLLLLSVNIAVLGWLLSVISSNPQYVILIGAWVLLVLDAISITALWKASKASQQTIITEIVSKHLEDKNLDAPQHIHDEAQKKHHEVTSAITHWPVTWWVVTIFGSLALLVMINVL